MTATPGPGNTRRKTIADPLLFSLGLCGVLSPAFLFLASMLGDLLNDNHHFMVNTISELYEAGAPNAQWLKVLFTFYHGLVIPFAFALHRGLPRGGRHDWTGPFLLGLAGLLGIPLGSYARCDPGCFGATTFQGILHGILVLATVLLIFAAMAATWLRLKDRPGWSGVATHTLVTLVAGVGFGVAMTPFIQGDSAGLLERISVAIILQWYVVMGVRVMGVARGR